MRELRQHEHKPVEQARRMVPLKLLGDERLVGLVEQVEPTRGRSQLMLGADNAERFTGLINEFRHADTLRRHGLKIRSKLLFCGPPGCGKSMSAEVFAGELGLPLLVCRLDAVISSFLGETASNLRKVFEIAQRQTSVLFFDEFDALARSRANGAEHNELRRVVNSLLMMIDGFSGRGFVIAATNLESTIDEAIWRRFDEVLVMDRPNASDIQKYLGLKTQNFPASFKIQSKARSLLGLSYADIERVCFQAIKQAILRGSRKLSEADFNYASKEELRRKEIRKRLSLKRR